MTLSVKHLTQSTKPATANSTDIDGPNWNEEHVILLTAGTLLGAWTSGDGTAAEVTLGDNLTMSTAGVLSASLGSGAISAVSTPVDGQIGVWTSATGLEGDANFTWSGTVLTVTGQIAGVTSFDATTQATIDAGVTITESQISDLGTYLTDITGESLGSLSDVSISTPTTTQYLSYNGSNWTNRSPLFADITDSIGDAQVPESAVTQHQAALAIVPANANGGAGASSSSFWRGDGVWAATETAADVAATAANVILTNADAAATAADAIATAADAVSTAADVVSTAALYDAFDDRYLGAFPTVSEPTVDNDGDVLAVGAIYWNTTENDLRFWTGSVWSSPEANTAADAVSTAADAAATAADVLLTNADVVSTNADVLLTNADVVSTNADAAATAADAIATAADVVSADAAAASAAASYDSFDDRYLGPKASEPTLDNDGAALITGALFFDTTTGDMKVWTGSAWQVAYNPSSGLLNVVEDLTPQLGGDLDAQGNNVTNLGDVTFKTGATGGTLRTGTSAADKFQIQAYDVDGAAYVTVMEANAGNNPIMQLFTDYFHFENSADPTKIVDFDLAGATTSTTMTVAFSQTASRTVTFPNATGTLALTSDLPVSTVDFDPVGTDNSTAVTFAGTGTYISLAGQQITVDPITVSDISDIAATYQPLDADLTSWAGVTRAAGFDTFATTPSTANFLSLVTDETFVMDADIGTTVQAYDADLTTWAGITPAANVGTFLATPTIANLSTALSDATISGNNTGDEVAATAGEINTGTEAVKYISPDALAGSNLGTFVLSIVLFNPTEDVATGDAAATFTVPACMAGLNVISARADHETAGTTGTTTITIRNVTQAADILSTGITISSGATTASDGTIDLAQDDLTSGDRLDFNVDTVTTTAPQGLLVTLECRLP